MKRLSCSVPGHLTSTRTRPFSTIITPGGCVRWGTNAQQARQSQRMNTAVSKAKSMCDADPAAATCCLPRSAAVGFHLSSRSILTERLTLRGMIHCPGSYTLSSPYARSQSSRLSGAEARKGKRLRTSMTAGFCQLGPRDSSLQADTATHHCSPQQSGCTRHIPGV
jgi:hypothetical protein